MADLKGYNANDHDPTDAEFKPLPEGYYIALITKSEKKRNNKDTGDVLNLTFEIVEGEHKGRNVWASLNLTNPSAKAAKIGNAQLGVICRIVKIMTPKDSVELHGIPIRIKTKNGTYKKNDGYEAISTNITSYSKPESATEEESSEEEAQGAPYEEEEAPAQDWS